MSRVYIGIDPGKSGAMATIYGESVTVIPFDGAEYSRELKAASLSPCVCCLEHVGPMPKQGVTSMFHFGENFGLIQGMLRAFGIPFELVRPQKWKKEFGISEKNQAVAVCERLFPGVGLLSAPRCKKPNDGMAEALLMAEYARRRL